MKSNFKIKPLIAIMALGFAGLATAASAADTVKIGFITDLSGTYSDIDGKNGAVAINMAIEDFGGSVNGMKVVAIVADHQNKADIAASRAREWFDTEGVNMVIGGTNSGAALAMAKIAATKNKTFIVVGAGSTALTGDQCTPNTIHYAYDTAALAKGTAGAVLKQGGKSWYFLQADYAFGEALQRDAAAFVTSAGGTVVGSAKHPFPAADFSSFMLQAQGSKAQILGLANAGGDTINAIKSAKEFGITKTMKLAGLLMFINDVHTLGLPTTQGMYATDSWYWDQSPESRAFSKRFFEKTKKMPSSLQAADYSATLQYLKAVKAVGSEDAGKVRAYLNTTKINDMYVKDGTVRGDGHMIHDMHTYQVKTPAESKGEWDLMKVVGTLSGSEAFVSKADSKCAIWK